MLAVKAYIGDPIPEVESGANRWSGILIGSNVAQISGLPWDTDTSTTEDFSGIIAVKNFDANPGDNNIGDVTEDGGGVEVSFALDAITGNAYFKGVVYAKSGVFNGTVYATGGTFTTGMFTDITVQGDSKLNDCTITGGELKITDPDDRYTLQLGGESLSVPEFDADKGDYSILTVTNYEGQRYLSIDTYGEDAKTIMTMYGDNKLNTGGSSTVHTRTNICGDFIELSHSDDQAFGDNVYSKTTVTGLGVTVSQPIQLSGGLSEWMGINLSPDGLYFNSTYQGNSLIVMPLIPAYNATRNGEPLPAGAFCLDENGVLKVANGAGNCMSAGS